MTPNPKVTTAVENIDVCLIRGPIVFRDKSFNNEATPVIGLAYLASYIMSHGYSCKIVDGIAEGLNHTYACDSKDGFRCQGLEIDKIVDLIPLSVSVIGFSAMFSGEWPVLRTLIKKARERHPDALFVAGGEHASALSEYCLRDCSALDICIKGEGEYPFLQLIKSWTEYNKIPAAAGIVYLDSNSSLVDSSKETYRIRNIDEIPWPHWPKGYLEKFWVAGKAHGLMTGRDMPIIFSRGCPYSCTFCSNVQMYTNRYVMRNVDDVIKEIKKYVDRYEITGLQAYDLTAIVKKKWIIEFCKQLKIADLGHLNWQLPNGTRSEVLDKETLSLLKETNCNYLVYAPESGSVESLIKIKKKIKLVKMTDSIMEAKRQGITTRTNLIVGFPHETWKNVFQTYYYGLKLSLKGVEEVAPNIFSPYPGTEIFDALVEQGQICIDDEYFFSLTSLNSDYLSLRSAVSHSPHLNAKLLALSRGIFLLLTYSITYFVRPIRLFRLIKEFRNPTSRLVFEQRIKDALNRGSSKTVS